MILKHELVLDAIAKHRPLRKLYEPSVGNLLDDYIVTDYVTTNNIPEIQLNGNPAKLPASSFFEKHEYLTSIELDDLLLRFDADSVKLYHEQKRFPYEYVVQFFDTFLVAEINPSSLETEFLVISPMNQGGSDIVGGLLASTGVTALFSSVSRQPGAQMALHIKIGELLECLRTGLGIKKRFGFF